MKARSVQKKVTLTSDEEAQITSEEEATGVHLSDEDQQYEDEYQDPDAEEYEEYVEYDEYEEQ